MGKPVLKIKGYAAEDIRSLLHSDPVLSVATRLNMVYQVAAGLSSRQVAKIYGVSFKQVINWVHRFETKASKGCTTFQDVAESQFCHYLTLKIFEMLS